VLKYDAPRQLVALVSKYATPPEQKWDILDLGCGTGPMGVPKMLDKARERRLYERLVQADLACMMNKEPSGSFDVAFAADVFVYIGKLDEVTAEARRLLRPGGVFAFSIETMEADEAGADYELQSSGRYRQSAAYVRRLAQANGFTLLEVVPTVIHMDNNKPINGYLVARRGGTSNT
jgi:predicted TPR repeat methyltransferase